MKTLLRKGQTGSVLLVLVVLIFLLVFLGYTFWQICKLLRKLPTSPANQIQSASADMLSEFQSNHVGEAVSVVSTQTLTLTIVQPFEATALATRIWRSTNLVEWDCIATNQSGETWFDPSPPWPNGFYKREIIR